MWVDGELKAENTALSLRRAMATMFGVLADIGYLRDPGTDSALLLSPFESRGGERRRGACLQ